MGGIKLLPQVREQWRPDRALRVGEAYDLYLVENGPQSQQEEVQPAETSLAHTSLIGIACEKTELVVTPGESTAATVVLRNQGALVDHFEPTVSGLADDWVTLSSNRMRLEPGESQELTIEFHPPRATESSRQNIHSRCA